MQKKIFICSDISEIWPGLPMEFEFIISGIVFGLSAGLIPGPLQTLVISQTLKHGLKEGILVSFAPLITDVPIIVCSVLVLSKLGNVDIVMSFLSFAGAGFLAYFGYGNLKIPKQNVSYDEVLPNSICKGILTNALNPQPYLFWLLVGSPTILQAYHVNLASASLFLISIYFCLVGTFITIALFAHSSRAVLKGRIYIIVIRGLGMLLLLFSLRFIWDGLKFLGVLSR